MGKKLDGKVAIVTGASKGIGASIARHFAREGASVVVNYATSKEGAEKVIAEIKKEGGNAIAVQADMSQPDQIARLFAETKNAFKKVDILVNNAGIYHFAPLGEITPDHFHEMFNLNVLGLLLASQEAAKEFGERGGNIINVSSVAAVGVATAAVYSATKAAVDAITHTLAQELGPKKIRVNSINPGMIETEGTISAGITDSDWRKEIEQNTPLGRIGKVDDVAPVAVFLASDDAQWVTGETIFIAGGRRN